MKTPIPILLQTTIAAIADDWNIKRFSLLAGYLACLQDPEGRHLFAVTSRDRTPPPEPDPVLRRLDTSSYRELWLLAVDGGDGLSASDCEGIARFRRRGGGLLVARDHMDLGCSVCRLPQVGAAHHFHSRNPERDPTRRRADDPYSPGILWPNYHSGANGDYQEIHVVSPSHPVLSDPQAPDGLIRYLPAHPHEGAVDAPQDDPRARVIARGRSTVTGVPFNIAVAFEPSGSAGPAIAESTFHHFADYNWDTRLGAPSFVDEPPGNTFASTPEARRATRRYVRNIALWLASLEVLTSSTEASEG
jgi:hypothetical protein